MTALSAVGVIGRKRLGLPGVRPFSGSSSLP